MVLKLQRIFLIMCESSSCSSSLRVASSMASKANKNHRTYRDALSPSLVFVPLHNSNTSNNSLNRNQNLSCNQDH